MVNVYGVKESKMTLYVEQGGRCWYCDNPMVILPSERTDETATWEHVTPIRRSTKQKGKTHPLNKPFNKLLVCHSCNNRRSDHPLTWFIAQLRQSGLTRGIVSRIQRLVNDHMPTPKQASEFDWYMLQTLAHPRRPDDALKRLPQDLEAALLPDPSQPIPLAEIIARHVLPMPKRKPILVRVVNWLWRTARKYSDA